MSRDDPTAKEFLDAFRAQVSGEQKPSTPKPEEPAASVDDHQAPPPEPSDADYLLAGNRKQQALVDILHPQPEPETVNVDRESSFDGGAREPAPLPAEPEGDHNELIAEYYWRTRP